MRCGQIRSGAYSVEFFFVTLAPDWRFMLRASEPVSNIQLSLALPHDRVWIIQIREGQLNATERDM